jgi:hypothetical protein
MSVASHTSKSWLRLLATFVSAVACIALALGLSASTAFALPVNSITLNAANWSGNAGYGSSVPAWAFDGFGVVHLRGAAKQISRVGDPNLLGFLPPGIAPTRTVFVIVHTFNGTYADLSITPNGQIRVIGPKPPAVKDLSFLSLESISFRPFVSGNAIAVNPTNWSPFAGLGTSRPGWYTDGFGIVHLQGAARQTSPIGGQPNLIGTLPPAATPTRAIHTIVHSANGTYADLVIGTDGSIRAIDPAAPAAKDYSLVSLESITYQPSTAIPVNPIAVNLPKWLPSGPGSTPAAWYKDGFAIVHLQGAARQVIPLGPNADLLGTLPAPAVPVNRVVYTIIATSNGTYADLSISPNGETRLIGPKLPAVKDYSFASLESITYQQ